MMAKFGKGNKMTGKKLYKNNPISAKPGGSKVSTSKEQIPQAMGTKCPYK